MRTGIHDLKVEPRAIRLGPMIVMNSGERPVPIAPLRIGCLPGKWHVYEMDGPARQHAEPSDSWYDPQHKNDIRVFPTSGERGLTLHSQCDKTEEYLPGFVTV